MQNLNFLSDKPLLYLVATPIGNIEEVSPRTISVLNEIDLIACEDTRVTSKLLSLLNIKKHCVSLREHNEVEASKYIVKEILEGKKVAYMSDAGYPCISDPGYLLVKEALENNINVTTISGPNAALNALCASGIETSHFYFHGFLQSKESQRLEELRNLLDKPETLIFYEAPHRIKTTIENMYQILGNRKACIARELTKKHEEYIRMTLEEMCSLNFEELKGEMVIVVEGKTFNDQPNLSNSEICNMVNKFIDVGLSTKDAIKKVAEATNLNKNYIYKIYHTN